MEDDTPDAYFDTALRSFHHVAPFYRTCHFFPAAPALNKTPFPHVPALFSSLFSLFSLLTSAM